MFMKSKMNPAAFVCFFTPSVFYIGFKVLGLGSSCIILVGAENMLK